MTPCPRGNSVLSLLCFPKCNRGINAGDRRYYSPELHSTLVYEKLKQSTKVGTCRPLLCDRGRCFSPYHCGVHWEVLFILRTVQNEKSLAPKHETCIFLQNIGIHPQFHTTLHDRRPNIDKRLCPSEFRCIPVQF